MEDVEIFQRVPINGSDSLKWAKDAREKKKTGKCGLKIFRHVRQYFCGNFTYKKEVYLKSSKQKNKNKNKRKNSRSHWVKEITKFARKIHLLAKMSAIQQYKAKTSGKNYGKWVLVNLFKACEKEDGFLSIWSFVLLEENLEPDSTD